MLTMDFKQFVKSSIIKAEVIGIVKFLLLKEYSVVSQNIYRIKRMLIMALEYNEKAFYELLPEKTTVNGEIYKSFSARYLDEWLGVRDSSYLWLLNDNARPHNAAVKKYLQSKDITVCDPYSPDISPLDFNCFGQLKRLLKGIEHKDCDEFATNLENEVNLLNRSGLMDDQKLLEI